LIRLEQRKGKTLTLVNHLKIDFIKFADYKFEDINELEGKVKAKSIFIYNIDNVELDVAKQIYNLATSLPDFAKGSYIYPTSKWNNIRSLAFFNLESHNNNSINSDIFYGDLPLDFHKERYTILLSDSFAQTADVDLFIPKPSYLEIEHLVIDYQMI
jgi:hypothetical protein